YNAAALTLSNCIISGNTEEFFGGAGIYNDTSGFASLTTCTLSSNLAGYYNYKGAQGAGIYNAGTLALTNCTVAGNLGGPGWNPYFITGGEGTLPASGG